MGLNSGGTPSLRTPYTSRSYPVKRSFRLACAREASQLQRHATHEHELHPGAGQGSQQLTMAILDLDHTDTRCSLRALRDE